ncbi:tautomerase-like protein [Paucimonas lemoignei]|uniref:Tautomerase-like protein n=1 Tax=Paucimonas lemoignei TaxID=29443 RepID=A0A4R3I3Q6_PAULE|nr:tautomerase family protein [Paucimonas lemoignei]TCS39335.1 tautomerase-like protein [Paucimonas lemoignei]
MPLVTLTVQKPKSAQFKDTILSAVHAALVASGVPETDRFHRVIELEPENFRFNASYPDLTSPRNEDFVMIEIFLSVGRRFSVKRQIVQDIVGKLGAHGFEPERVMICFNETAWENWSLGGGRFCYL